MHLSIVFLPLVSVSLVPEKHRSMCKSIVFIWLLATDLVGLDKQQWILAGYSTEMQRTVDKSTVFDAEKSCLPCINMASKHTPYRSIATYSM